MIKKRIIPVLLVEEGRLIQTKTFRESVYLGDPINTINIFNQKEVDEIIVLDIAASRLNTGANISLIKSLCSECFMPVAYGGGISSLDEIGQLFNLGIEKVVINTASNQVGLIESAVDRYGSQSIVGAIDIYKGADEKAFVYEHVDKKVSSRDPIDFALSLQQRGVGEIFINFVCRDGERIGYDDSYIQEMSQSLSVPLIACGGARDYNDLVNLANDTGVSAVAAGSVFSLLGKYDAPLVMYPSYEFLKSSLS